MANRWYPPPPKDRPGDVLRWVRRVSFAAAAMLLLFVAILWAGEDRLLWPVLVCLAVTVVSTATMGPAIRRADARGVVTDADELARMRRSTDRTWGVVLAVIVIAIPAFGYATYGTATAVFLFVAGALYAALVIGARRRAAR